jgi:hypothetical protein
VATLLLTYTLKTIGITEDCRTNFLTLQVLCNIGDVTIMSKEDRQKTEIRCISLLCAKHHQYNIQSYLAFDADTNLHRFVSVKTFDGDKFRVVEELLKIYGKGTVIKPPRGHDTLFIDEIYQLPDEE